MDSKSIGGAILTFVFGVTSKIANKASELTLSDWAAISAIVTGVVTTLYTVWKWNRDSKKK